MDFSNVTGLSVSIKPGQEEQKFGDMFNEYAASGMSLFSPSDQLSIGELENALSDNFTINITTENGEEALPSGVSAAAIFGFINTDMDIAISTEEMDAFLEGSEYDYADLAEMNLEDAVNTILNVGMSKFQ
ncbi:MAG: hypothetical protein IJB79_08280 [Candidatus Gastranaerophilales bacterium]|nr:hypothetical protein [Candidatus Gastranaerophilales bacterium]